MFKLPIGQIQKGTFAFFFSFFLTWGQVFFFAGLGLGYTTLILSPYKIVMTDMLVEFHINTMCIVLPTLPTFHGFGDRTAEERQETGWRGDDMQQWAIGWIPTLGSCSEDTASIHEHRSAYPLLTQALGCPICVKLTFWLIDTNQVHPTQPPPLKISEKLVSSSKRVL